MNRPVTFENEHLRIQVYPHFGGKVASLVDKADGYELFFNFPDELPTKSLYDATYSEHWFAGWDECFPAIAPSPYVGHPYDGIRAPDHGELWGLPTTAVPTNNGITTVWHGLRFGYRLTRKLHIDGPTINADYTLVNLAPFPFSFVWAMHALMSTKSPVKVDLGPANFRRSHGTSDTPGEFTWPMIDDKTDLSSIADLPANQAYKVFSTKPIKRQAVISYPTRGRTVQIKYTSADVNAYWGVWINTGGWMHHQHFAIEPTTGRFDQLDACQHDGSAGKVEPQGTVNWSVQWTLGSLS